MTYNSIKRNFTYNYPRAGKMKSRKQDLVTTRKAYNIIKQMISNNIWLKLSFYLIQARVDNSWLQLVSGDLPLDFHDIHLKYKYFEGKIRRLFHYIVPRHFFFGRSAIMCAKGLIKLRTTATYMCNVEKDSFTI